MNVPRPLMKKGAKVAFTDEYLKRNRIPDFFKGHVLTVRFTYHQWVYYTDQYGNKNVINVDDIQGLPADPVIPIIPWSERS